MYTYSNEELLGEVSKGVECLQFLSRKYDKELLGALEEVDKIARKKGLVMLALNVSKENRLKKNQLKNK